KLGGGPRSLVRRLRTPTGGVRHDSSGIRLSATWELLGRPGPGPGAGNSRLRRRVKRTAAEPRRPDLGLVEQWSREEFIATMRTWGRSPRSCAERTNALASHSKDGRRGARCGLRAPDSPAWFSSHCSELRMQRRTLLRHL